MADFVRYSDGIEAPLANEQETIAQIVRSMKREAEKVAEREHHAVRASHAKSTGLLKGELRVLPGLPPHLAQGLFAQPRSYPAVARFAQGPGEHLSDSVSTHRGMAVKLFGVDGPALAGHEGHGTQDFVFATGVTFEQSNPSTLLVAMKGLEKTTNAPQALKTAVAAVSRVANAAVQAVGGDSPTLAFFGHPKRNPLADAYFSQAALRYGDHVAKLAFFPVSPELVAMIDETLDTSADPDAFRTAVVGFMRDHSAEFELRAQLCTSLDSMPVEDASVVWPEDESPYVPVARLVLPPQDAHSTARTAYFDDVLAFRPAHTLAAHRPLGSLMRARLTTYGALSAYRHGRNGKPEVEPASVADVPD